MPKCYLLAGDTSEISIFSLRQIKINKQQIYPLNYLLPIGLMLTISKVFIILCLLCLCGEIRNTTPWQLSKQISKLFFQMGIQVYSVPDQTEGRREPFLEWTSINLSSKLSLTCGSNVNYYKSAHHPIPALPVGIRNIQATFKTNQ